MEFLSGFSQVETLRKPIETFRDHLQMSLQRDFRKAAKVLEVIENKGTPGRTRTCDPLLRRQIPANKRKRRIPREYQAFRFKELALAWGSLWKAFAF